MPTGVYPRTKEWGRKLSLRFKGRPATEEARTPEARAKMRAARLGKSPWSKGLTKETDPRVVSISTKLTGLIREKPSWNKGIPQGKERKAASSIALKGRKLSKECVAKMLGRVPWNKGLTKATSSKLAGVSNSLKGHEVTKETRLLMSTNLRNSLCAMSEEQKAEWLKAHIKPASKRPNKAEITLSGILDTLLAKQYVYTGDGQIIVNGLCPDFVNCNGQRKIIELFGNYWHTKRVKKWQDTELGRQMAYNYCGFNCLVVWESELVEENRKNLTERILKFHAAGEKSDIRRELGDKVNLQEVN